MAGNCHLEHPSRSILILNELCVECKILERWEVVCEERETIMNIKKMVKTGAVEDGT